MSKKLIAVASAAALALTALVGIAPATASSTAVLGAGFVASSGVNDGTTADKAATVNVPSLNTLTAAGLTAGLLDIGATTGDVIEITTTGSVKVIRDLTGLDTDSANWNVSTLGKSTLTYGADQTDDSYVYSTSTTAGSVTVKVTSATLSLTKTFYVKGVAGLGHALKVTGPSILTKTKVGVISATVTDIFGNAVEDQVAAAAAAGKISITVTRFPDASASGPAAGLVWNATAKNYQGEITSASDSPFTVQVTMVGGDAFAAIPDIDGIADAEDVKIFNVNSPESTTATTQVAALTAQLAALQIIKDRKVSKLKYNTLARKWNAAFPSQKVWVKP
jgi:hypothetical protein